MRRNQVRDAKKLRKVERNPTRAERRHLPIRSRIFSCRAPHARRYDLWPGAWEPQMGGHPWARVELRIAVNRAWMLREAWLLGSRVAKDALMQGCVISRVQSHVRGNERLVRGERGRIATVLLNEVDLLERPSEIGAHEMTHAAMVFMRLRGVDPMRGMEQEEALCYTVGELVKQLNCIFYAHSYRRPSR